MRFSLILQGVHEVTPELANTLFEATGGDIEFSACEGQAVVDFDRPGPLRQAVEAAIAQLEKAGISVARAEPYSADRQLFQKINANLATRCATSGT
jgi:hypothetical protein